MKESVCNNCKYFKSFKKSYGKCIKKDIWKSRYDFCKKYYEVKE